MPAVAGVIVPVIIPRFCAETTLHTIKTNSAAITARSLGRCGSGNMKLRDSIGLYGLVAHAQTAINENRGGAELKKNIPLAGD